MNDEKSDRETAEMRSDASADDDLLHIDRKGMFSFFLSICLGVLIGQVKVPLPGGLNFFRHFGRCADFRIAYGWIEKDL